jgi:hypothetical protein
MKDNFQIEVKGHLKIADDLGNIYIDKDNAVHPQNMARVIARALANENNYFIHRIAYGNGGTLVDPTGTVNFRPPRDGLPPDLQEWRSRLYNETYSEIIDDSNVVNIGTDPGSAGPSGTRPGGGAVPSADPITVTHVSGPGVRSQELGVISQVVITSVLNPLEPAGQLLSDLDPNPTTTGDAIENSEGSFVFDEVGLYTTGAQAAASPAVHQIDVGNKTAQDDTGLCSGQSYEFDMLVNATGSPATASTFTVTPVGSGSGSPLVVTYGDLVSALNTILPVGANGVTAAITDNTVIPVVNTNGYLTFTTNLTGAGAEIVLSNTSGGGNDLFTCLESHVSGGCSSCTATVPGANPATNLAPVAGADSGVQNQPTAPTFERERLLTHLVFSPVTKTANRTFAITYTLTVSVRRST